MKQFSFPSLLSICQRHWLIVALVASAALALVLFLSSRSMDDEIDTILRDLQDTTGADVSDYLSGSLLTDTNTLVLDSSYFPSEETIQEKLQDLDPKVISGNLPRAVSVDRFTGEGENTPDEEQEAADKESEETSIATDGVVATTKAGATLDLQQFGEVLASKIAKVTTAMRFGKLMESALEIFSSSLNATSSPSALPGVLYHPNGEILSWAMFYKMLADKMGLKVPQQSYTFCGTGVECQVPLWYAPYETWFYAVYPDFPRSNPADPAVKAVVLQFFDGQLPEGVYEVTEEVEEEVSDATVFHPSGEPLNWAAFYKLLAEENPEEFKQWLAGWNALRQLNLQLPSGGDWYSNYERWFRELYPQYPYFAPTDTVNLEIILDLFAGDLPEGVYTEDEKDFVRTVSSPTYGTDLLALIPSGSENNLLHPNGEVLSWAMFYKMLAEKQGAVLPKELVRTSEWFTPYETWFRKTYPALPVYAPADPALPSVVSGLYGGLPAGVTLSKPFHAAAPNGAADEVLYHPNGEILSWAMFYKFLAEKKGAVLQRSISGEWFTPYEKWFRATYPYLPLYKAAEAAYPEVVADLFGGLPPGVTFGSDFDAATLMARIQKLALPVVESTDSSPVAYDASLQDGELYAKAFYGSTDEAQLLYGTHDRQMTWADLWPHIVQAESTKTEGGRPIPYSVSRSNEAPYMIWFRQYFPELPVPLMSDVVTVDEAKFFLQGTLPRGSYGVDAGTLDLLGKISQASVIAVSPLPSTSTVEWVVDRNDDIPTYTLTSPEDSPAEFQAVDQTFDIFSEFIASLGADREILEANRELEESASFQAFIDQLVNGADGEMSSFFELFDEPNQESLGSLTGLLAEPTIPNFLESLDILSRLFAPSELGSLPSESDLLSRPVPSAVPVFENERASDPDFNPLLECSQDEEGSIWDDAPECDL